jgi:hypothetical protein
LKATRKGSGADLRHDKLILVLLLYEARNAFRSMRIYDRVFLLVAGGFLLACSFGNLLLMLHQNSVQILSTAWIWLLALPAGLIFAGLFVGVVTAGLCVSRAFATFLLALPLSVTSRRRMVVKATLFISGGLALAVGLVLWLCCDIVRKPDAAISGVGGAMLFFIGSVSGLLFRIRNIGPDRLIQSSKSDEKTFHIPGLERLDSATPAWIGSWACRLPAGRFRVTRFSILSFSILGLMGILSSGASLAQHVAAPAVIDAVVSGLGVFMLSVRCQPLGSPVLRSAPLGFIRSWFGILRLPIILSAIFFAMPASVAIAAEPSSWTMPVGGGVSLLLLDAAYAIFAAYFMTAPLVAAVSFVAVLSYVGYKWFMYHDLVYFCLVIFLVWLGQQARKRFLHG